MAALHSFVLVCLLALVSASHYRYGTISWTCQGNIANISIETAWRQSYWSPMPIVGTTLFSVGNFLFGDGTQVSMDAVVNTVNSYGDWVIASSTLSHTYNAPNNNGAPFIASFSGNARITTLQNNANQPWFLTTSIDCTLASSPISKMLPIANVMPTKSPVVYFRVPGVTDDETQINYSLGTSMDICGTAGCTNPPNLSVDPVTGVVTWDTTGLATGLWCAVININTPTVRVPVDFIINYTKVAGTCAPGCSSPGKVCYLPSDCGTCTGGCLQPLPPYFIPPTPLSNTSYNDYFGQTVNFSIVATSPQSNYFVSIQSASLPPGATLSAPSGTNPVTRVFSWVADTVGPTIVCFSTNDDHYMQSPQYCITISITNGCRPACPDNSFCSTNGSCVCVNGYSGSNCTDFGGQIFTGSVYGAVGMLSSNYYFFNLTTPNTPVKLVVDTLDAGLSTSIYLSTTSQEPSITDNQWSSVSTNPNTIVVLPTDPDYIVGTYYLAVEGWYTGLQDLVNYQITLFLS